MVYKWTHPPAFGQWSALYHSNSSGLVLCPLISCKLLGRLQDLTETPTSDKMEEHFSALEPGGRHKPKECLSRSKVAIIVPIRDREENLRTFLYNIHQFLKRQQLYYGIYVVEQNDHAPFNNGRLMNIGFLEAFKQYDYQCFIFHDVDHIPLDDRNLYTCAEQPRHLSKHIANKNYIGGTTAFTREQFETINGFSNEFWGWGGEDNDVYNRIRYYGYNISRPAPYLTRYKLLEHKSSWRNPERYKKLSSGRDRYQNDGINNIRIKYKLIDLVFKKLYTWILVGKVNFKIIL